MFQFEFRFIDDKSLPHAMTVFSADSLEQAIAKFRRFYATKRIIQVIAH